MFLLNYRCKPFNRYPVENLTMIQDPQNYIHGFRSATERLAKYFKSIEEAKANDSNMGEAISVDELKISKTQRTKLFAQFYQGGHCVMEQKEKKIGNCEPSEFWDHVKATADEVKKWPDWKKGESISTLKNVMIPRKNEK